MPRRPARLLALLLAGCAEPPPLDTDVTFTPVPTATNPTDPSPYSDEASVVLLVRHTEIENNGDDIRLAGLFTSGTRGYHNLAACFALQADLPYCAEELPEQYDTSIDADAWDSSLMDLVETRQVGLNFKLGPYTANYSNSTTPGGEEIHKYYAENLDSFGWPVDGELQLEWDGDPEGWPEFMRQDVVSAPDPMEILSPSPGREITLSGEPFPLRWVPGLVGDVYLSVENGTDTVNKLFLLEDDGSFDLDVPAMGLVDGDIVMLTLSRWSHALVDQLGNTVEILVQDEQILRGSFRDLGGLDEIEGADTCAEAAFLPPLQSGAYYGRLSTSVNDLVPSGSCGNNGAGPEVILRAEMTPDAELIVDYGIFGFDAALYLMAECGDFATCLDGSDNAGAGVPEQVGWTNDLGGPTDVYVVLDSRTSPVTDLFVLGVDLINVYPNVLVDSCAESVYLPSLTSSPAGTDRYVGNITTFHNYADPAGTCYFITDAPGQEGMVKVELADGETLTATVDMPGADPVLYLLYNCAISASCGAGADASAGPGETLEYQNTTGVSEVLYLIVDSHGGSAGYTLDVLIQ